jgi:hypothetical protein
MRADTLGLAAGLSPLRASVGILSIRNNWHMKWQIRTMVPDNVFNAIYLKKLVQTKTVPRASISLEKLGFS